MHGTPVRAAGFSRGSADPRGTCQASCDAGRSALSAPGRTALFEGKGAIRGKRWLRKSVRRRSLRRQRRRSTSGCVPCAPLRNRGSSSASGPWIGTSCCQLRWPLREGVSAAPPGQCLLMGRSGLCRHRKSPFFSTIQLGVSSARFAGEPPVRRSCPWHGQCGNAVRERNPGRPAAFPYREALPRSAARFQIGLRSPISIPAAE